MEGGRYFRTGAYEKEKYFIEDIRPLCILIYLINVKKIWCKFEEIVKKVKKSSGSLFITRGL